MDKRIITTALALLAITAIGCGDDDGTTPPVPTYDDAVAAGWTKYEAGDFEGVGVVAVACNVGADGEAVEAAVGGIAVCVAGRLPAEGLNGGEDQALVVGMKGEGVGAVG